MRYYYSNEYIAHHGIKGQKWGVRRFQNKDGSLTPAGKKRYDIPDHIKKSTHRQRLEKKYQEKKGMTKDEAEQAAARRIQAEKYVAIAATITVGTILATKAYRDHNVDKVLSKDTAFQRIMNMHPDDEIIKGDRDYVAYKKGDKVKYKGILGKTFQDRIDMGVSPFDARTLRNVENVKVKAENDIKVASPKRARETFVKLFNENEEFRNALKTSNKELADSGNNIANILKRRMDDGTVNDSFLKKKGYEAFNIGIANKSDSANKANKMFFEELKKQGMQAVGDINDKKYSGYNAKDPLIIFDGKLSYERTKLGREEIEKNYEKAVRELTTKGAVKSGAVYAGAYLGAKTAGDSIAVRNYKKAHPNTKMTNDEILAMLKKEQKEANRR